MSEALLKISNVAGYGNISVLHEVSRDMSNMGRMKVRFTGYADMADEELQTELQTEPRGTERYGGSQARILR